MSDFTDWTQAEMAERPSIAVIAATGSILVKANNLFSKDYEALAQGTVRQVLESQGTDSAPIWVDNKAIITAQNSNAGTIVIGSPVYTTANDTVDLADADNVAKVNVIGFVKDISIASTAIGDIQTDGIITATIAQWDAISPEIGGLIAGAIYYLSDTAGEITRVSPTTTGWSIVRLGIALSTTDFKIEIQPPILL